MVFSACSVGRRDEAGSLASPRLFDYSNQTVQRKQTRRKLAHRGTGILLVMFLVLLFVCCA